MLNNLRLSEKVAMLAAKLQELEAKPQPRYDDSPLRSAINEVKTAQEQQLVSLTTTLATFESELDALDQLALTEKIAALSTKINELAA